MYKKIIYMKIQGATQNIIILMTMEISTVKYIKLKSIVNNYSFRSNIGQ